MKVIRLGINFFRFHDFFWFIDRVVKELNSNIKDEKAFEEVFLNVVFKMVKVALFVLKLQGWYKQNFMWLENIKVRLISFKKGKKIQVLIKGIKIVEDPGKIDFQSMRAW